MIILTGGAGFIGINTLDALIRSGRDDVLVVDNIGSTAKWQNLVGRSFRRYLHKQQLWEWLQGHKHDSVDAVIHLGACSDTMEYDFDYLNENNTHYSIKLWNYCTWSQIPYIYASSAATYGDGSLGFSDDHSRTPHYQPINPYGFSKHLFDLWALKQADTPPRWYGLKFFNVFGPHEHHKGRMASVASFAIPQARDTGTIRLFRSYRSDCRDGDQKRDFVYVEDAVNLVVNLLDSDTPSGLYNVGSGQASSFNRLAKAVFDALGIPARIEYFDMPDSLRDKYQYYTEAEMQKLISTGYRFQPTSLEEGVARYTEWLLGRAGSSKGRPPQ